MRNRAWMFLWRLALAACAAGCEQSSAPLGDLPTRDLAFIARSQPANSVRADAPQQWPEQLSHLPACRDWRYIVIHHSATAADNAHTMGTAHRAKGWDDLGYHFVIDNGSGGQDGQVEVGPRWRLQKWGAHAGGTPNNEYNNHGIGICVVGDFSNHLPSQVQLASLRSLVAQLAWRYDILPENIIGHRDAPGTATQCPGDALHDWIDRTLRPAEAALRR